MSSGDDQPAAKRQKTYSADGPIEDDKTAREKLREAGFDPDDVHTARSGDRRLYPSKNITPMVHFAYSGDLPMCRYLYHVRGASTTTATNDNRTDMTSAVIWFPIYAAARSLHWHVVKWLYQHGAKDEMLKPLHYSLYDRTVIDRLFYHIHVPDEDDIMMEEEEDDDEQTIAMANFLTWLVSSGFLENDLGEADREKAIRLIYEIQPEIEPGTEEYHMNKKREILRGWLAKRLQANHVFRTFLLGTLPNPPYSVSNLKRILSVRTGCAETASLLVDETVSNGKGRAAWSQLMKATGRTTSANACLAPLKGVLEKISDYVGVVRSKTSVTRIRDTLAMTEERITEEELRPFLELAGVDEESESDSE